MQLICRELQLLYEAVREFDQKIAAVFKAHEDHELFASFPGAGPVLGPRLLASLGSERERFLRASHLQCFSGIAPVTKQSGGTCYVHRRHCCSKFLKQSFYEYANTSILFSRWAAAYYLQQRQKGCAHHTAVRALAFKWQRIIWKCWQTKRPYRKEVYEAALRTNGSPLVALLEKVQIGKSPFKSNARKS